MKAVVAVVAIAAGCDPGTPDLAPVIEVSPPALRVTPVTDTGGEHRLLVLVNTPEALYRVDPDTLDVTLVGTFDFPDATPDKITDIAMDRRGRMWAVGFEAVYRVDPKTLACTKLAAHPGRALNALAIMASSAMAPHREVPDLMIAAESRTQTVYQVDPATGALAPIGDLGGGLSSSGDLTWAPGVGAVMVTTDMRGYEGISRLDPDTFTAHPIGTGWAFEKMRALTMLPRALLGATEQGELIEIDPATGDALLRKTHPLVFYGGAIGWDDTVTIP